MDCPGTYWYSFIMTFFQTYVKRFFTFLQVIGLRNMVGYAIIKGNRSHREKMKAVNPTDLPVNNAVIRLFYRMNLPQT